MKNRREILWYKNYFTEFYVPLPTGVRSKIKYDLELVRTEENIPVRFFKHLEDVKGLYEIRIEYESNIYRIFCCLDKGKIVVLFNGIQKKSRRTPLKDIQLAARIMKEYFKEKKGE